MMVVYDLNVTSSRKFDSDEPNVKTTVDMSDSTRQSLSATADADEPSPASKPKNKWFDLRNLPSLQRWDIFRHSLSLNSNYPDVIDSINQSFPLLPALAKTYIAIDRLNQIVPDDCLTSPEAIGYIIQFAEADPRRGRKYDTIRLWGEYMKYVDRHVDNFAPDFTQWDESTRELERLANDAIAESKRVFKEHNPPEKRLPKEVENGIFARTGLLQRWKGAHLETVRARDDYKKWKAGKDALQQSSQLRNRRGYPIDGTATTAPLTTISTPLDVPEPYKRSSKPRGMDFYFQSDLTIWSLNLTIYLTCAILQATSTSRQSPSPPDYLAATQTTLTQLLSVLMTYILTIRNDRDCRLGIAYRLWFVVAAVLPLVGLGVLRWDGGVSALVMFVGTAVTGVLQVLLAVYMKRVRVLPS